MQNELLIKSANELIVNIKYENKCFLYCPRSFYVLYYFSNLNWFYMWYVEETQLWQKTSTIVIDVDI